MSPSSAWRSWSNADTSRQNPGGTRNDVARRPRLAVLPPTVVASNEEGSSSQGTCMARGSSGQQQTAARSEDYEYWVVTPSRVTFLWCGGGVTFMGVGEVSRSW